MAFSSFQLPGSWFQLFASLIFFNVVFGWISLKTGYHSNFSKPISHTLMSKYCLNFKDSKFFFLISSHNNIYIFLYNNNNLSVVGILNILLKRPMFLGQWCYLEMEESFGGGAWWEVRSFSFSCWGITMSLRFLSISSWRDEMNKAPLPYPSTAMYSTARKSWWN